MPKYLIQLLYLQYCEIIRCMFLKPYKLIHERICRDPTDNRHENAFDLTGNALITGGNRSGKALLAMAEQGANIAILCRNMSKAEQTLDELSQYGGKYESFSCDVADLKNVRKAVAEVYDLRAD